MSSDRGPFPGFERLVRTHQAMVWRYLRFLGCDDAEARDLTQDTFLRVLDRPIDRFGEGGTRAYLRRVARNAYLRSLERAARRPVVDLDVAEAAYEWYRGDDEGESTRDALDACLETLSDQARRALELRFGERFTRDAIAAELGIGAHGIKSLLQRSYARLRVCIERRLSHEPA
ncbi:MAG: sigma-70 family RNA polymerase sigma factor [Planctomycetes bacterium]|nr:sigma-70 family RNA polymerase sigma factor [Planctomycetota bacterium]